MERMGTSQVAAFYLGVILVFLTLLYLGLFATTLMLLSVHWSLAVLVFAVTTISFAVGLWREREQLRQVSWRTGDKSLRSLSPLVMPLLFPFIAWMMVIAFSRGGVFGLVFGAFVSLTLLELVTGVALRLTMRREFSVTLLIGRGTRAVWRKAAERVGVGTSGNPKL